MSVPAHLTIAVEGLPFDKLLADWRWLVPEKFTPIMMTAFGNLFLRDEAGQIQFLDSMAGELKVVAESQVEFEQICDDREKRRVWFLGFMVTELRRLHGPLAEGECYSCKIPLSLGGQMEVGNFEREEVLTHYSILGQVHRQTKHLPPGTQIDKVNVMPPSNQTKSEPFWRRILNR